MGCRLGAYYNVYYVIKLIHIIIIIISSSSSSGSNDMIGLSIQDVHNRDSIEVRESTRVVLGDIQTNWVVGCSEWLLICRLPACDMLPLQAKDDDSMWADMALA